MIKSLKSLFSDSVIYGLSGVITKMIGIFLIPLYTRLFEPNDYGVINLINTTFFLLNLFVILALDNSAGRWFYDSTDEADHKKTFASWIWFQFGVALLFCLILVLSSNTIVKNLFPKEGKVIYIILPAITLITNTMPGVIINWFRVHKRPKATVIFSLSQALVTIGLSVLFVIVLKWHIAGVLVAPLISSTLFSLVAIVQMKNWIHPKYFNKQRLQVMLKYALPFIPAALAYWLLNSTDSYFITFFKNKAEAGIFGIGASLAAGIGIFTGAFQQAWGPFAFSIMHQADAKQVYAKVFLLYGYIMSFLAASIMLFAPEILQILTAPEYYSAAWVAGILAYNLVMIGFTYIAILGCSIAKITAPYGYAMLGATLITVVLDILLIPTFGKEGSAIATLIAQLFVPAYLFYKSNKVYPIPYNYTHVCAVMISMAALVVSIRLLPINSFAWLLSIKIGTVFLLLGLIWVLNRSTINQLILKIKNKKV